MAETLDIAYSVEAIRPKGHQKILLLRDVHGNRRSIAVHRFAMVGMKDQVFVGQGLVPRVSLVAIEGRIPVSPLFEVQKRTAFAGDDVEVRVAEIATLAELKAQIELEAFHYRGLDLSTGGQNQAGSKKGTGGRRALLILQIKLDAKWTTIGYIELQMPLMMAKPRHVAFARPFHHPKRDVRWEDWRKGGQALVNLIARIARVVVHPDYRSAGMSGVLVTAAIVFARERWHIGGLQAQFLEISAEMLRHIDFVSRCGFHYLGNTEGNRARLAKDMLSMKKGRKGGSGILGLQRRYFSIFEAYRKQSGESFESLQTRLSDLLTDEIPWEKMSLDEWLALRPVIRTPIPYYVIGLDPYSDQYVREAAVPKAPSPSGPPLGSISSLSLKEFTVEAAYSPPHTPYSRLVMDAFGIATKTIRTRIFGPINVVAEQGTVVFVSGPSGCGKSLLLSALDPTWHSTTAEVKGQVIPANFGTRWLTPLPEDAVLFEYLASKYGPERSFDALSRVGLSEALLFLKPFGMLSRGQRYRAMLANLILGPEIVWLIDEFCSDLDPLSARIVAHRLRRTVRAENRIAFVAAANHRHYIKALSPKTVLLLETNGTYTTMTGLDYIRDVSHKNW